MGDRFVASQAPTTTNSTASSGTTAKETSVQEHGPSALTAPSAAPGSNSQHASEPSTAAVAAKTAIMPPQQNAGERGCAAKEGQVQNAAAMWLKRGVEMGGAGVGSAPSAPADGGGVAIDGGAAGDGAGSGDGDNCESLEAATARLHLGGRDDEQGAKGGKKPVGGGGDNDQQKGQQDRQNDESRKEREREPQPKFGLKVLVPGITAGCLIGKGGKIINQLQAATGTRVKLSQKDEFFPGTHDRVALVQGEHPTMVAEAVAEMLRRLREAERPNSQGQGLAMGGGGAYSGAHEAYGGGGPNGRDAQVVVRLLVPLAAGGLIIGRGGETIKAIGARTGARVILAGKDADVAGVPSERLCSIHADLESGIKVVYLIVGKMAEDRGLSKYQSNQTCYQTGTGVPAVSPGMGRDASMDAGQHQYQHLPVNPSGTNHFVHQQQHQQAPWLGGGGGGVAQGLNHPPTGLGEMGGVGTGLGGGVLPGSQQNLGLARGGPGAAMGVRVPESGLAGPVATMVAGAAGQGHGHGHVMGQGQAPPSSTRAGLSPGIAAAGGNAGMGVQHQQQQQQAAIAAAGPAQGIMAAGMMYGYPYHGLPHQGFPQGNMGGAGMPSMYPPPYGTDISVVPGAAGLHQGPVPEFIMDSADAQTQVAVPDHLVGVILGKGGATVIDLQNQTGASIQVSQRGEYIPGTSSRPVTISGTQRAVASAQLMLQSLCGQAAQTGFHPAPQPGMQQQQQQHQYYSQQQGLIQPQRPQPQQQHHVPPFY